MDNLLSIEHFVYIEEYCTGAEVVCRHCEAVYPDYEVYDICPDCKEYL